MDMDMGEEMLNSIRTVLKDKRVSQRKLALILGKSPTQVNKWVLGKNEIGVNSLIEIADVLNIGLDELLGRMTDQTIPSHGLSNAKESKVQNTQLVSISKDIEAIKNDLALLKAGLDKKQ
jgi:transcriptional regulator with XRE-family HTH domain